MSTPGTKCVYTARRENSRRRPRGYADWGPQARTRELLAQVNAVLDDYRDHLPLSVRQIFYRLVAAFDYPKTENAYSRLGEHLVRARRARMIPFDAIRDDGIVSYSPDWHAGPDDFMDHVALEIRSYRRDRQERQPVRVELWCEAAGMAPQLSQVAERYSVPVFSAGGFTSLTATRRIADRALDRDVPTVLLHVGDFDPSGASIFAAMVQDAAAFVEADRIILPQRIEAERVALTAEQVEDFDLPTAPAKATDSRSQGWKGGTCQLEALAPDQLAAIVDEAIGRHLRTDLIEQAIHAEDQDRAELYGLMPGSPA